MYFSYQTAPMTRLAMVLSNLHFLNSSYRRFLYRQILVWLVGTGGRVRPPPIPTFLPAMPQKKKPTLSIGPSSPRRWRNASAEFQPWSDQCANHQNGPLPAVCLRRLSPLRTALAALTAPQAFVARSHDIRLQRPTADFSGIAPTILCSSLH